MMGNPNFIALTLSFLVVNLITFANNLDPDQKQQNVGPDLFDLILYAHSTIFQLCGTGLPGLNQY